jgi:hypothetical protein
MLPTHTHQHLILFDLLHSTTHHGAPTSCFTKSFQRILVELFLEPLDLSSNPHYLWLHPVPKSCSAVAMPSPGKLIAIALDSNSSLLR